MGNELVLRQIVARDANNYLAEIPIPSDQVLVLQRFSRSGHVGSTIELQHIGDKVHVRGTWGVFKVNLTGKLGYKGSYSDKCYVYGGKKEYDMVAGGKLYLGPDGVYQLQ